MTLIESTQLQKLYDILFSSAKLVTWSLGLGRYNTDALALGTLVIAVITLYQSFVLDKLENSIRPVALGRKNYLFAGSHEAAKRSGMLYSLLGTCKMHSVEPYTWLKNVLQRIPTHPINKVHELLPHRWNK